MGIKQLPKPQTGNPALDRVLNEHVDKLNPILRELPPVANGQIVQGQWFAPAFVNGWSQFLISGFIQGAFMLDTQGFVHLRGLLLNVAGQASGLPAFILPGGFRPQKRLLFPNLGDIGASRLDVFPNGEVWPSVSNAVAANGFRSLDGISFDTRL